MDRRLIWLSRLALVAVVVALFVIGLGAYTRLTNSGLGCPDWPGCFGHISVPSNQSAATPYQVTLIAHQAWTEMIHRYCAGILAILVLMVAFLSVMNAVKYGGSYIGLSCFLFMLLIYQAILGMWTVTLKLWPTVVAQHLLGGMTLLVLLWIIFLKSRYDLKADSTQAPASIGLRILAIGGLVFVFIQVALGAWTSTNYAALSCSSFPFCQLSGHQQFDFSSAFNVFTPVGLNYEGGLLSEIAKQTIQMTHRVGALVVSFYLLILAGVLARRCSTHQSLRRTLYFMLAILMVQIGLGILNVVLQLPLVIAVLHNLSAALLLCTMMKVVFSVYHARPLVIGEVSYA